MKAVTFAVAVAGIIGGVRADEWETWATTSSSDPAKTTTTSTSTTSSTSSKATTTSSTSSSSSVVWGERDGTTSSSTSGDPKTTTTSSTSSTESWGEWDDATAYTTETGTVTVTKTILPKESTTSSTSSGSSSKTSTKATSSSTTGSSTSSKKTTTSTAQAFTSTVSPAWSEGGWVGGAWPTAMDGQCVMNIITSYGHPIWKPTPGVSSSVDPTSTETWAEWTTTSSKSTTSSKKADPTTTSSTENWEEWTTTSSKKADPTTTSSTENWGEWTTTSSTSSSKVTTTSSKSTTSSKKADPTTTSSTEKWEEWSTASASSTKKADPTTTSSTENWAEWSTASSSSSSTKKADPTSTASTENWAEWSTASSSASSTKKADPTTTASTETWAEWTASASTATSSKASSASSAKASSTSSSSSKGGAGISSNGDNWAMTYTPYTAAGACKDANTVSSDMAKLASKGFTSVRVYSTDCSTLENVGSAARANNIKLILGVFISSTGVGGAQSQVSDISKWAQWDIVSLIVIGNEAIFNNYCSASELASFITSSKSSFSAAGYTGFVTTTEDLATWQSHGSELCSVVDVVAANLYAFFNPNTPASQAGSFIQSEIAELAAVCSNKETYVMESGWPSAGECNGVACPGVEEQKTAIKAIQGAVGSKIVFFSFEDEAWKGQGEFGVEQHWGCADVF